MSDKQLLPEVIVFAGPNGSGKTTIKKNARTVGKYINADDIKRTIHCTDKAAAKTAERLRETAVKNHEDFTFETVLSTDRNLKLLKKAKEKGYFVRGFFILTREKDKSKWEVALARIEPGKAQFKEYETECIRILKYILGNFLTLWETQEQSNGGLYRFDMCCKIKNGANKDFFDTIMHYFGTKYIVFEFKNYNEKISQKEIYTTEKYLYEKALRKVAIIVSRCGADEHALQAARGSLRETGKLILCLSDNDLLKMIKIKEQGEQDPADFLGELLDDLLVHLEK